MYLRTILRVNHQVARKSPEHEEYDQYLARYLTTGEAKIIGAGRRSEVESATARWFPVHLSVGEMRIAGERKFTGLLHHLTKRAASKGSSVPAKHAGARWSTPPSTRSS
jgi:hypothetical protein